MFNVLRKRVTMAMGMKTLSFDDLEHIDLESVDSICLSDVSSIKSETTSDKGINRLNSYTSDSSANSSTTSNIEDYSKKKVVKLLKSIKKLEKLHAIRKESKMSMLVFIDMIRDQQYQHVSMCMLSKFMKSCKMVPKSYYLHYFMYFLYYAAYYHHQRATIDIIDDNMKDQHEYHFKCIKAQIKYLNYIIKESRVRSEITL